MKYIKIKYCSDKILAIVLVVLLCPLILFICVALVFTQGEILFVQVRSGYKMRRFKLYKFRTLIHARTASLSLAERQFTFLGKFLRISGLDELPQLWNIIKGEMSFIGPRPLPVQYDDKYKADHKDRFNVKPGITGLAQIKGKNKITWRERFYWDGYYVKRISLLMDLKIISLTVVEIIKSVLNKNADEMPVFNGINLD